MALLLLPQEERTEESCRGYVLEQSHARMKVQRYAPGRQELKLMKDSLYHMCSAMWCSHSRSN